MMNSGTNSTVVDLRSDTVTRPSAAMREAMATAEVGDHVLGDDPTAAELERRAAEILGQERALYFPSGTMANQTAIHLHGKPGTLAITMWQSHLLLYEEGGAAAWSGVQLRESGEGPEFEVDRFVEAVRPPAAHLSDISLVCLENTHNTGGGRILPIESMKRVRQRADQLGLPLHLDGARLPNAAVASGLQMRDWGSIADTVMVSLSKGLGAPVGSILAGSAEMMERAAVIRRRFGGAMRQAGILAAAGLFALENNLSRLTEDHRLATRLAEALIGIDGIRVQAPETNIVIFELEADAGEVTDLIEKVASNRVLLTPFGGRRIRAVTHLDVSEEGIDRAALAIRKAVSG